MPKNLEFSRTVITVREAEKTILQTIGLLGTERVDLEDALGRCLREPVLSDRPLPPFDRSTMDGVALSSCAYQMGRRRFKIEGCAPAGAPRQTLSEIEGCMEIMTGAPLPEKADCIVPLECYSVESGVAHLQDKLKLEPLEKVHPKGSDSPKGAALLEAGLVLSAKEIAVAASVGKTRLLASKQPRIAIVSTGDELVPIDQAPQPHQIRRSNDLAIATALASSGYPTYDRIHLADSPEQIRSTLGELLSRCDCIILAGGVSKGKHDYVPEILVKLGVAVRYQWVSQRPGKPMWYGQYMRDQIQFPVFALPGNPASCLSCLTRYVIPGLRAWTGQTQAKRLYAKLRHDLSFKPPLTLFLPATLEPQASGELWARPALLNSSGDFVTVSKTDGFLELPKSASIFREGEAFSYFPWPL